VAAVPTDRAPEIFPRGGHEPAPPTPEPELPRRRSTVREPASSWRGRGADAATPPTIEPTEPPRPPAASPTETEPAEDTDRPRRSGWWSRRVLGKG
jgi:ribonuclease E